MSLDFVVFCRERPRFTGDHDVGPVCLTAPTERSAMYGLWLKQLPKRSASNPGDWMVKMNCRAHASAFAHLLGKLIAERSGGGWIVCDAGDKAVRVLPNDSRSEDILPDLQRLIELAVSDHQAREMHRREQVRAAYELARQKDPTAYAEANDWSDV